VEVSLTGRITFGLVPQAQSHCCPTYRQQDVWLQLRQMMVEVLHISEYTMRLPNVSRNAAACVRPAALSVVIPSGT
jgi:hypothetical protein